MTPEQELVYAAGFFDGEGCITARSRPRARGRTEYPVALYVGQVAVTPLLLLKHLFGGTVSPRKNEPGRRPMYMWRTGGVKASAALEAMLPYLIVKRYEAEIALQLRDLIRGPVGGKLTPEETAERVALVQDLAAAKRGEWRG